VELEAATDKATTVDSWVKPLKVSPSNRQPIVEYEHTEVPVEPAWDRISCSVRDRYSCEPGRLAKPAPGLQVQLAGSVRGTGRSCQLMCPEWSTRARSYGGKAQLSVLCRDTGQSIWKKVSVAENTTFHKLEIEIDVVFKLNSTS
jgi:hypothetical protein